MTHRPQQACLASRPAPIHLVLLLTAGAVLGACSSDDDGDTAAPLSPDTASESPFEPVQGEGTVAPPTAEVPDDDADAPSVDGAGEAGQLIERPSELLDTEIGSVLVGGAQRLTLYTFDEDEPGTSNCFDACATTWPPALNEGAYEPVGPDDPFSTVLREEGIWQWALFGRPLYFFAGDTAAGETNGEGSGGVWFVVSPQEDDAPPSDVLDTSIGEVLVTAPEQRTVYTFDEDEPGTSNCVDACAETWPPVLAERAHDAEERTDGFATIRREDGTWQWTLADRPLYLFAGDAAPGDVNGEGSGDVWFVARPLPLREEAGRLVGSGRTHLGSGDATNRLDRDGHTLYVHDGDVVGLSYCTVPCTESWPPLYAEAGAAAPFPYSIIEREDGTRQYAHEGRPLHFYAGDAAPGAANGEGESGQWWTARPTTELQARP